MNGRLSYGLSWLMLFLGSGAWGQEAEQQVPKAMTLWGMIVDSGWIGFTIILCSIASLAMIIEFFMTIRRDKLIPSDLLQDIEESMEDENYEEVIELCESNPSYLSKIITASLIHVDNGYQTMLDALHTAVEKQQMKLFQKIGWLQVLSAIGPMLGLLGTVVGIIQSFGSIVNMEGSPKPKDLAGGILLALVTTVQGLLVATPNLVFYYHFRNRVTDITTEGAEVAEEVLERFRTES